MEKNEFNDVSKTNNNNKNKAINMYCVCVLRLGPRTRKEVSNSAYYLAHDLNLLQIDLTESKPLNSFFHGKE